MLPVRIISLIFNILIIHNNFNIILLGPKTNQTHMDAYMRPRNEKRNSTVKMKKQRIRG